MLKAFAMVILVAGLPLLLGINEAAAKRGAHSGSCPVGTCAQDGGAYAKNVNHCSKENCRRR
jgi:hypothetical protein